MLQIIKFKIIIKLYKIFEIIDYTISSFDNNYNNFEIFFINSWIVRKKELLQKKKIFRIFYYLNASLKDIAKISSYSIGVSKVNYNLTWLLIKLLKSWHKIY